MDCLTVSIKEVAVRDDQNLFKSVVYISKELGELSDALLQDDIEHAQNEAMDVVVAALAAFYQLGGTREFIHANLPIALERLSRNV